MRLKPIKNITQIVKPSVHDAGVGGVDGFDLVLAQGPGGEPVVVLLPPGRALVPDQGPAAQQPLRGRPVGTHGSDPLVIHPAGHREHRSVCEKPASAAWEIVKNLK